MNSITKNIVILCRRDFKESVFSRWFVLYSLAFAGLGLCVSYISAGAAGMGGFGRTSAGLINLVLLVVPLMGLTAGAGSIAGDRERGSLAYLLAQPVSRLELLAARYIALGGALAMSVAIGFGLSAGAMALQGSHSDAGGYLVLVGLTIALALSMLSIGMLISVLCRRTGVATGIAVFTWLILVFATDLGLMAGTMAMSITIESLFSFAIASPLQVFKMASLQLVDASLDVLGPAGLYAQNEYGRSLPAIFATILLAWIVMPMIIASFIFQRRSPL